MFFRSNGFAAVVAAILAQVHAHIIMQSPVPYSMDKIDSSPITASQFPCKSQNGFTVSSMNNMAVGSKQTIKFKGTAVHGGGSCQLSVTMDTEPTADSVFKVIKSIEGGCPGVDSQTNEYEFELPTSIPNGKATFAWTWFSKMSGAPELYMNCAPIEVTGGASDQTAFKQLPDMFVANIGKGCTSPQNFATKFPNPGKVVQMGTTNDQQPPTGSCGSSSGVEPPTAPISTPPSSPPSGQYPTSDAPPLSSIQPGYGYGTGASVAGPVGPPKGTSTRTTLITVTGKPTRPGSGKPTVPGDIGMPGPTGTGSTTIPTAPSVPSAGGSGSGTCTSDGAVVCNGPTQFGICNQGKVVWQSVAAGTTCTNGAIAKRGYNGRIALPRVDSRRIASSQKG